MQKTCGQLKKLLFCCCNEIIWTLNWSIDCSTMTISCLRRFEVMPMSSQLHKRKRWNLKSAIQSKIYLFRLHKNICHNNHTIEIVHCSFIHFIHPLFSSFFLSAAFLPDHYRRDDFDVWIVFYFVAYGSLKWFHWFFIPKEIFCFAF